VELGAGKCGGNMKFYNEIKTGKAGEFLVCCDLAFKGFSVFMNEQQIGYDLVVDTGKKILRVQVKTCIKPGIIPQRKKENYAYIYDARRYGTGGRKRYSPSEIDVFAFVALDIMKVAYLESKDVGLCVNFRPEKCKGEFRDEIGIACYNKIIGLKGTMTQREIAKKFNISEGIVSRMFRNGYKPHITQARYFLDFCRDREWFLSL
jgi:hypothetical protein